MTDFQAPSRRRDTLKVLLDTRGNVCSEIALRKYVRAYGGYSLPAEQMRDDIYWLQKLRLVKAHETDGVLFATLIERGRDVAQGDLHVDGVDMPDVMRG